jgi:hypothetical protein|nr:hypothetical protein [uncultured Flavobacterium sp.]
MRYTDLSDIGGFLWWILIKFRQTKLKEEQSNEKWARNIFFLIVVVVCLGWIVSKVSN